MMINNLFNYATSELSQDAFICWLASFSLQESRSDIALKKCADEMIGMFVPELKNQDFVLIDIKRQVQHVDVLLTVKSDKNIYKIIVEDKTHTREHDNQLKTYLTQIKKSFPESKVCGVYYKTGFQCNLSPVSEAGYTIVTRENMLALLKKYVSETNNQILHDYFNYWSDFQSESEKFRNVPLSEWEYRQINGFYDHLKTTDFFEERKMWIGYDYVANRNGGFYGLWAGKYNDRILINDHCYELYLQMETVIGDVTDSQLCLKLAVKEDKMTKETIRAARDQLIYTDDWTYKLKEYNFSKPKRLAVGEHMTIGVYNAPLTDYTTIIRVLDAAVHDYKAIMEHLNKEG